MKASLESDFSVSVRHQIWEELPEKVVFYVSDREFEVFSQELSALAQQTPGVQDSVKISEIKELEVSKFLLAKIVDSPHFSTRDLKILRREDKYPRSPLVGETKPQSERAA